MPINICHRCLYLTEIFTDFREKIRVCETKLQKSIVSAPFPRKQSPENRPHESVPLNSSLHLPPDEGRIVVIVDPTKDYVSDVSESSVSDDSDAEEGSLQIVTTPPLQPLTSLIENNTVASYSMATTDATANNQREHDGIRNIFFCQFCDTAFVDQIECTKHEQSHESSNPHQCNFCPFRCAGRNTIIAHIKECHEPSKPFVCIQCQKKFGRRSDLKKHSIVHTGVRPFGCPECGKNFSRNTNLTKHLRIHSGLKPHVCQKCPRSFTTKGELFRHSQVHTEAKPFQCTKCPSTFSRRDKFLLHERSHVLKEGSENIVLALNPFHNNVGQIADTIQRNQEPQPHQPHHQPLQMVVPTVTATVYAQLPISHTSFSPLPRLDQLISQITPPELQPSPIIQPMAPPPPLPALLPAPPPPPPLPPIEKMYFANPNVTPPTTVHSPGSLTLIIPKKRIISSRPKKFICDSCPKRFATQSSLLNHKNVHLGLRNHVCLLCDKTFARKRELDRHSVIHTGYKPYSCAHCPKKFGRKDKLVRHERIHMEEKLYSCPQCALTFSRNDTLLLHMRAHVKPTVDEPQPIGRMPSDILASYPMDGPMANVDDHLSNYMGMSLIQPLVINRDNLNN